MKAISEVNAVCKTVVASFIMKHNKLPMSNRKKLFLVNTLFTFPSEKEMLCLASVSFRSHLKKNRNHKFT